MIKLEKVSINYGKYEVIKNFSLEIQDGEFLTILGYSGSGKTTILRGIAGLEKIRKGKIWFDDIDVTNTEIDERKVGFIFQNYTLFSNMNVFENIAFGLKNRKIRKDEIEKKVHRIANLLQISNILDKMSYQLSGGQQQRVAIARSLVLEPKILLFDEPFSNLDKELKNNLIEEVYRLNKETKTTIIYVTHDQNESFGYSDKILVMNNGQIEQIDTPKQIYNNPKTEYVAKFLGDKNKINDELLKQINKNIKENKTYYIKKEDIKIKNCSQMIADKLVFKINKVIYNGYYYEYEIENKIQKIRVMDFNTSKKYNGYVKIEINPNCLIEVEKNEEI